MTGEDSFYSGISHPAFVTSDMDMTVRFWRDLLGMPLTLCFGGPGFRQYFFTVSEGIYITFFEWPGAEPVQEKEHGRPVRGPVIFDHLAIGVLSDDSLWEIKGRLDAADIWVSEVIDHGFIRSIYCFDPNGIPIEFSLIVEGVDAGPLMADRNPTVTALEGPEPRDGVWPRARKAPGPGERRVYPGLGAGMFSKQEQKPNN